MVVEHGGVHSGRRQTPGIPEFDAETIVCFIHFQVLDNVVLGRDWFGGG